MDFPIFAARGTNARMARQALEDLAALNLLRDFIWIDVDGLSGSDPKATVVRRGEAPQQMRLEQAVGAREGAAVQLHGINIIGESEQSGLLTRRNVNEVTERLRAVNADFAGTANNLMFTEVNASFDEESLPTFNGYRNLLVAPEDSKSPDSGATIFQADDSTNAGPSFSLWVATSIASLAGLWVGFDAAPAAQLEPNSSARLVRCYTQRVSGEKFQQELQNAIFDLSTTPLPQVVVNKTPVNVSRDAERGTLPQRAAQEFIETHARDHLVTKPRETMVQRNERQTRGQALGNAFGQWAKNLFGRMGEFWSELGSDLAASADAAVQSSIYGNDSSVTVGRVDVAQDQGKRAVTVVHKSDDELTAGLRPLWSDYAGIASGLVDAKPYRTSGERPNAMQKQDGLTIVQSPSDSIPGPSEKFGPQETLKVRQVLGSENVAPYDIERQREVYRDLNAKAADPEFMTAKANFERWQRKHQHSFAANVGAGLRGLYDEQQTILNQKQAELQHLKAQEHKASQMSPWHGILRWLGWVTFWSLAVFLIAWWIGNSGDAAPRWQWVENLNNAPGKTYGWMFGIWFALWLIFYMLQILISTLHSIRSQKLRMDQQKKIENAERAVAEAQVALRCIEVAYPQFIKVSDLYGALLEKPFGDISNVATQTLQPTNALPESINLGEVEVDKQDIDHTASVYRRRFFDEGWLTEQLRTTLEQAARDIANDPVNPLQIDLDNVLGSPSSLSRLASRVSDESFLNQDRSTRTWAEVVDALREDDAVKAKLQPRHKLQSPGYFRQDILTPLGVNRNLHDVVENTTVHAESTRGRDLSSSSITLHAGSPGASLEDIKLASSAPTAAQPTASSAAEKLSEFYEGGDF